MVLKYFLCLILLIRESNQRDDDDDSGRPYEFGFTIDSQQHRYEKKDVNGIVQGEFGFITADGVYHVTVYATDENGNFRILSMRNIRLSGPLDQPDYKGIPNFKEAFGYKGDTNINVATTYTGRTSTSLFPERGGQKIEPSVGFKGGTNIDATVSYTGGASTSPFPERRGKNLEFSSEKQQVALVTSKPFSLTVPSTLKPGCGGCGIVTSTTPTVVQKGGAPSEEKPGGASLGVENLGTVSSAGVKVEGGLAGSSRGTEGLSGPRLRALGSGGITRSDVGGSSLGATFSGTIGSAGGIFASPPLETRGKKLEFSSERQRVVPVTPKPFSLTVASTVKPGCSGCGIVTSTSSTVPKAGALRGSGLERGGLGVAGLYTSKGGAKLVALNLGGTRSEGLAPEVSSSRSIGSGVLGDETLVVAKSKDATLRKPNLGEVGLEGAGLVGIAAEYAGLGVGGFKSGKSGITSLSSSGKGTTTSGEARLGSGKLTSERLAGVDLGRPTPGGPSLGSGRLGSISSQITDSGVIGLPKANLGSGQFAGEGLGIVAKVAGPAGLVLEGTSRGGAELGSVNIGNVDLQAAGRGRSNLIEANLGEGRTTGENLGDARSDGVGPGRPVVGGVNLGGGVLQSGGGGLRETSLPNRGSAGLNIGTSPKGAALGGASQARGGLGGTGLGSLSSEVSNVGSPGYGRTSPERGESGGTNLSGLSLKGAGLQRPALGIGKLGIGNLESVSSGTVSPARSAIGGTSLGSRGLGGANQRDASSGAAGALAGGGASLGNRDLEYGNLQGTPLSDINLGSISSGTAAAVRPAVGVTSLGSRESGGTNLRGVGSTAPGILAGAGVSLGDKKLESVNLEGARPSGVSLGSVSSGTGAVRPAVGATNLGSRELGGTNLGGASSGVPGVPAGAGVTLGSKELERVNLERVRPSSTNLGSVSSGTAGTVRPSIGSVSSKSAALETSGTATASLGTIPKKEETEALSLERPILGSRRPGSESTGSISVGSAASKLPSEGAISLGSRELEEASRGSITSEVPGALSVGTVSLGNGKLESGSLEGGRQGGVNLGVSGGLSLGGPISRITGSEGSVSGSGQLQSGSVSSKSAGPEQTIIQGASLGGKGSGEPHVEGAISEVPGVPTVGLASLGNKRLESGNIEGGHLVGVNLEGARSGSVAPGSNLAGASIKTASTGRAGIFENAALRSPGVELSNLVQSNLSGSSRAEPNVKASGLKRLGSGGRPSFEGSGLKVPSLGESSLGLPDLTSKIGKGSGFEEARIGGVSADVSLGSVGAPKATTLTYTSEVTTSFIPRSSSFADKKLSIPSAAVSGLASVASASVTPQTTSNLAHVGVERPSQTIISTPSTGAKLGVPPGVLLGGGSGPVSSGRSFGATSAFLPVIRPSTGTSSAFKPETRPALKTTTSPGGIDLGGAGVNLKADTTKPPSGPAAFGYESRRGKALDAAPEQARFFGTKSASSDNALQPPGLDVFSKSPAADRLFPGISGGEGKEISRVSKLSQAVVKDGKILVPGNEPIPIKDKYPGMTDGLPKDITEGDIIDLLYKFNYTFSFHGHYEKGLKNGAKIGGYFVNGRDGISRIVTYVADENGYRPKVQLINLGLDSPDIPKEGSEKKFGLKGFEFVWYPIK